MKSAAVRSMAFAILFLCLKVSAVGATIAGIVKGSDGKPLKGAFVEARGGQISNFATVVLSNKQGQYRIENLSSGEYQVSARKIGYSATAPVSVNVAESQSTSQNFDLQASKIAWTDISITEGEMLLPDGPGKRVFFTNCIGCHGFQRQVAAKRLDLNGWRGTVRYMRTEMRAATEKFTDEQENLVAAWFNQVFGKDSKLPASPQDLPNFNEHWRGEYSDEAMNIVYGVYDLPRTRLYPFSARPDKHGMVWVLNIALA